jgi:hypothetical protein
MQGERETMRRIREAVANRRIPREFRAANVNKALGIDWAGTFLPKHCEDNARGETERFVRVSRGLYRLRQRASTADD